MTFCYVLFFFFFFQAEDGIRDLYVTGVQTCALPIWPWAKTATASPSFTPPRSAAEKPVDMMSGQRRTSSSSSPAGILARFACAFGKRTYSAWQPLIVLPNLQPPMAW